MKEEKRNIIHEAFSRHSVLVDATIGLCADDVARGAEIIVAALQRGNKIFVCGNGGSAADSQHFAAEFIGRYKSDREPFPAIALTTDSSAITAIGNDYGFEDIFSRQIKALGLPKDVLVALTTSGQSKNILKTLGQARVQGLHSIVLTGENGGHLTELADVVVSVPSSETARIQEMHELIYHAWCEFADSKFNVI